MNNQLQSKNFIDVVIPAHIKDKEILDYCICGIKKNVKNLRRVIVVSKEKYSDNAEWFDEKLYPFSFAEISEILNHQNVGWNYQQLLKLYSVLVIPNISSQVLIVDADTVFYRPVEFINHQGLALYNMAKDKNLFSSKFQISTLAHIAKILPQVADKLPELFSESALANSNRAEDFTKTLNFLNNDERVIAKDLESGICHHMLIQKNVIESLFSIVQNNFNHQEFYKIFLQNRQDSFGVAEYNLYFYFLITHFPSSYAIRLLRYKNTAKFSPFFEKIRRKYHYCSYHSYMRKSFFDHKKIFTNLKKLFKKLFYFEQWNIGILNFDISKIFSEDLKITWLESPRKYEFNADPFAFEIDGKKFIIYEKYSLFCKRGRIFLAEFTGNKIYHQKLLLDNKKHLSYPFVFGEDNKIYITCESYKANNLELFEFDKINFKLNKVRDIFVNKSAIDPTIFKHQNQYFLFYTDAKNPNENLNIAFANSLFDEFCNHPKNPVKIDISNARPAGNLFTIADKIYRPAQNCSKTYGGSIIINEIKILDSNNFHEEKVFEIKPSKSDLFNQGLHTISTCNSLTLIDGKRSYFLFTKPLIALIRKLKEIAC
jgi:hypothetical protein